MAVSLTVCGLHVVRGDEPYGWQTGLYHEEVVEPDPANELDYTIAVEFTKQRVAQEGAMGAWDATFFAAAIHPGHIDRCAGFDFADIAIDDLDTAIDADTTHYPNQSDYTVCGILLETGRTTTEVWTSRHPLAAYYAAWQQAQDQDLTFLLACIHEGEHIAYELPFAEPSITTQEDMQAYMKELDITA